MGENRFQKMDASLTEESMLAEEQRIYEQHNPEDSAAQLFYMYSPQYRNLIRTMPTKAMRRLLVALVEGVLAEKAYKPTTNQEKAAFILGDKLMQARWVMQLHTLSKVAQEVEAAKAAEASENVNQAPEGSIPLSEVLQSSDSSGTMGTTNSVLNKGEE
jgi:hypothetical protein